MMRQVDFSQGYIHVTRLNEILKNFCDCKCHRPEKDYDFIYHTKALMELANKYFVNLAPVIKGTRVRLNAPINFEDAYGWTGAKEWMIPGAEGEVFEVAFSEKRGWNFSVIWDDDPSKDARPYANYNLDQFVVLKR